MKTSFTPGPYRRSAIDRNDIIVDTCPETRTVIATVCREQDIPLLAAAPDLFATLSALVGCHDSGYAICECENCLAARAAIAKASPA